MTRSTTPRDRRLHASVDLRRCRQGFRRTGAGAGGGDCALPGLDGLVGTQARPLRGNASPVLRSAYPIILGVGGWLLGALMVLGTMPSVPVDDELLVALSVGLPVILGICLA
jgi:hypothetical protein